MPSKGKAFDELFYICYNNIVMQRMMLMISGDEYETLRRLSFERRVPIAKLIRAAIDGAYGTNDDEIQSPGRKPEKSK